MMRSIGYMWDENKYIYIYIYIIYVYLFAVFVVWFRFSHPPKSTFTTDKRVTPVIVYLLPLMRRERWGSPVPIPIFITKYYLPHTILASTTPFASFFFVLCTIGGWRSINTTSLTFGQTYCLRRLDINHPMS